MADSQNVAQVALQAGNSPRMVFSNYRELVRPADAKKWFAITPESVKAAAEARRTGRAEQKSAEAVPTNIVSLPNAAVA